MPPRGSVRSRSMLTAARQQHANRPLYSGAIPTDLYRVAYNYARRRDCTPFEVTRTSTGAAVTWIDRTAAEVHYVSYVAGSSYLRWWTSRTRRFITYPIGPRRFLP